MHKKLHNRRVEAVACWHKQLKNSFCKAWKMKSKL